ncbi:MAG: 6,7-dimethyl-8-ribityllumazine synthase [Verrucomicrobia bacterium]|nr:6,7-dimethyl-8-ribityllumazine synthase [Kiritimatiellia bacterium]MCO6400173.1 6,7-dimethyl-8-ribityllumazine synthase [Verrucomicrobiota bacterium]
MKVIIGEASAKGLRIGIAISRFNDLFTRNLLAGALETLERHGANPDDISVVWVPGAFELPSVLRPMAVSKSYDALIALGVVIQGSTGHAGIINGQVAASIAQIAADTGVPVIDGVIGAQTTEQAMERSGGKQGNRGSSVAETAIEMANVLKKLSGGHL